MQSTINCTLSLEHGVVGRPSGSAWEPALLLRYTPHRCSLSWCHLFVCLNERVSMVSSSNISSQIASSFSHPFFKHKYDIWPLIMKRSEHCNISGVKRKNISNLWMLTGNRSVSFIFKVLLSLLTLAGRTDTLSSYAKRNVTESECGVDNQPTKHFRGVEQLQEFSSSLSFICSKTTIRVPHTQELQGDDRRMTCKSCNVLSRADLAGSLFPVKVY